MFNIYRCIYTDNSWFLAVTDIGQHIGLKRHNLRQPVPFHFLFVLHNFSDPRPASTLIKTSFLPFLPNCWYSYWLLHLYLPLVYVDVFHTMAAISCWKYSLNVILTLIACRTLVPARYSVYSSSANTFPTDFKRPASAGPLVTRVPTTGSTFRRKIGSESSGSWCRC